MSEFMMHPFSATILRTHDLAIGYAPPRRSVTRVAEGLSLSLRAGEFVCLIGPNGAGKSTLIRTLAGIQAPLSGQVRLMDDDIQALTPQALAKRLSIVLTDRVEVGALSAHALVALGRYPYTNWMGRLSAHDERVIGWAIEAVGAQHVAHRNVSELSDGERQKVMIARALAQEPQLMILDEPTAFLDVPRRVEILGLLQELAHKTNRAILLSTHDLELALRSADCIWLLPVGGRLHVGAPEDLVLNGAFERVFQSEGVAFNPETGTFRMSSPSVGEVALAAGGPAKVVFWTTRALERAGFQVVQTPAGVPVQVEILVRDGAVRWRSTLKEHTQDHPSLDALIRYVKAAYLPQLPHANG
jgi:iron complex transport system ATP-binding protein